MVVPCDDLPRGSIVGNQMTPRRRLIWQLGLSAAGIIAILSFVDLAQGQHTSFAIEFAASFVAAGTAFLSRTGRERLGANILMALVLLLTVLFDTGFGEVGGVWSLYIPILLLAFVLDDHGKRLTALSWLALTCLAIFVVNQTDWTPRLASLDPSPFWTTLQQFACSACGSWLCLRFYQKEHARLLRASQELALDLRSALHAAQEASQAKSDFLSHMSHEFRTPLNAISGFAQILLHQDSSPSEAAENLQAIRTSADHLVHLIGDVLDLSRMEQGKLVLAKTPFHPVEQMHAVHSILQQSAREKGLALELEVLANCPWVEGDPLRWRQIVLNLGSNAIKYTSTGSIHFRLSWEARDDSSGFLTMQVCDTGPGIPPEDRKAIFERFRRLPTHESGPVSGAGLGLSIASDLVEAMDGTLGLESEVGVGSTFTFTIPSRIVAKPSKPSSDSWTAPWNPKGFKILLCEDNRLNVRLATQVLTRLGVDHSVAYDGKSALELLSREHFDALLLDLHMPHHNGFEVTHRLRHSDPPHPLAKIPILALTADASEETRKKTREAGMDDFLAKPFHLPELEERLRRLLRRRTNPEKRR